MDANSTTFLLFFAPERWSWLDRYSKFAGLSQADPHAILRGTEISRGHLRKYDTLVGLANKIAKNLWLDTQELEEHGHSRGINSSEYAALLETLVCELYSSIDGLRRVLYHAFRSVQGIQDASNEKLLKRASERAYKPPLPDPVSDALSVAYQSWFPGLRRLRKELVHGEIGSCHRDAGTGQVSYFHRGLGTPTRSFVSESIVDDIAAWRNGIGGMCDAVFRYLYAQLPQQPVRQTCGVYKARLYKRDVEPKMDLNFNEGYCKSRQWFDEAEDLKCPLCHTCLAYNRRRDPGFEVST